MAENELSVSNHFKEQSSVSNHFKEQSSMQIAEESRDKKTIKNIKYSSVSKMEQRGS